MADNDNTRGRGRGTGRGINRGRGRVRNRGTTTLPQPSVVQPTHPSTGQSTHPSTSHTHVAPQPPRSTPSPHPSFTEMLHSSANPSTPSTYSPADVVSGDDPRVSSSSPQIRTVDTDGRMWIRPGPGNTFDPTIQPTREIIKIIKTKFEGCWETYGEAKNKDKPLKKLWWKEFQRKFKWLLEHKAQIKKTYHHKTSNGYSNAMYRVRRKIDSGSWIPVEMREQFEH